MSSLSDLLNQYSQDISARVRHQDDTDREIQDRKAQTIQEKYQQVRDHFESAANDLMGAGAAIHMGRKVYNKWADRNAAARQSQQAASDNANDAGATAGDRPTLSTSSGNQPTRGATGATDEPAPVEPEPLARGGRASAAPGLEPIEEDPNTAVKTAAKAAKGGYKALPADSQAKLDAQYQSNPDKIDNPQTADDFRHNLNIRQQAVEQEQNRLTQSATEATAPDAHIAPDSNAHAGAPAEQAGTEGSQPLPEGFDRQATPLRETRGPNATGNEANVDNPVTTSEGGARFTPEDIEEGAKAFSRPGPGAVSGVGDVSGGAVDGSTGALDAGINGAKSVLNKVGSKAGATVTEGIGDVLPEVSGVLDALGPIGEIFGVITSIAGAIEGATSKPAEEKAMAAPAAGGQAEAGAGMDEKALSAPVSQAGTFTA